MSGLEVKYKPRSYTGAIAKMTFVCYICFRCFQAFQGSLVELSVCGTVQVLYSFHLFQISLHCWMMISLLTMLGKQPFDTCFYLPLTFCFLHYIKHCNLVRLTCRCFQTCRGSDNLRQNWSPHHFVFLLKFEFL